SRTKGKKWMYLEPKTVRHAHSLGLPVQALLSPNEAVSKGISAFVRRRNDTAHGNVSDVIRTLSDYDPGAEAAALDQLQKALRFVRDWFNSSPDVQQKRIKNHRWP